VEIAVVIILALPKLQIAIIFTKEVFNPLLSEWENPIAQMLTGL
jgi:hypothetical protein